MTGARQHIPALRPLLAAGQHLRRVVEAPAQGAVAGEQEAVAGDMTAVADMTAAADMIAAADMTAAVADMAAEGDYWPSLAALAQAGALLINHIAPGSRTLAPST